MVRLATKRKWWNFSELSVFPAEPTGIAAFTILGDFGRGESDSEGGGIRMTRKFLIVSGVFVFTLCLGFPDSYHPFTPTMKNSRKM